MLCHSLFFLFKIWIRITPEMQGQSNCGQYRLQRAEDSCSQTGHPPVTHGGAGLPRPWHSSAPWATSVDPVLEVIVRRSCDHSGLSQRFRWPSQGNAGDTEKTADDRKDWKSSADTLQTSPDRPVILLFVTSGQAITSLGWVSPGIFSFLVDF